MRLILNWGRRYSLWVFNFGLACCAIEFIASSMSRHDFIRLGVIPFAPGPRQADLMVVSGTVTDKMAPAVKRLYDQMPEPKYVISFGACSNSGGPYWDSYCVTKGVDQIIPVDVYVPGLPATARGTAPGHPHAAGEDQRTSHSATATSAPPAPARSSRSRSAAMTTDSAAGAVADRLQGPARVDSAYGQDTVDVPRVEWVLAHEVARDLGFTFFDWLTGVDQLDAEEDAGFDVVSHLWSMERREHLLLRTRVPGDDARLATLTGVFSGASWHERETFEMFGLVFDGHPHLVPLLLPDGFEGHPLRKDFVLAARAAKPWPGAKEPGESDADVSELAGTAQDAPARRARPRGVGSSATRRCHVTDVLEVVLRVVLVLGVFLVLPLLVGQTEHKAMAHMQSRLGPMYAGGFHGWAQLVADGVKFAQKEDIVPAAADRAVFKLAPAVALIPYLVVLVAIPVGPDLVAQPLDVGLFFVLAVMSVGVLGALMAGGRARTSSRCSVLCALPPS